MTLAVRVNQVAAAAGEMPIVPDSSAASRNLREAVMARSRMKLARFTGGPVDAIAAELDENVNGLVALLAG
jgi:hypothetical protein